MSKENFQKIKDILNVQKSFIKEKNIYIETKILKIIVLK